MAWLIQLARQTWQEPEAAFRQLIGLGLPQAIVWQATVVMAILLVGINFLAGSPPPRFGMVDLPAPFVQFALQLVFLVFPAGFMQGIGYLFDRSARLADCLLVILWAQFVLLPIQILFALTLYRAPGISGFLLLFLVIGTMWFLTVFINALFNYGSRWRVLLALFGVMLALGGLAQTVLPAGMI